MYPASCILHGPASPSPRLFTYAAAQDRTKSLIVPARPVLGETRTCAWFHMDTLRYRTHVHGLFLYAASTSEIGVCVLGPWLDMPMPPCGRKSERSRPADRR